MRLSNEQLNAIKNKYNVKDLWSFSRINTYLTSPYCFYLKYILHEKEDKQDGIYAESGALVHNILEKFYNHEIAYEDMIKEYQTGLVIFEGLELQYNKTDVEKNAKIANKYEACIRHFFLNHQVFQGTFLTEQFALTTVGPYVFQGYIDFVHKSDDGIITIIDFKTSTIYKGEKVNKESKQLLLYAQSLIQHGIPINQIKIKWDFLKYTKVKYQQKNGEWKEREIERNEIGSKLSSAIKTKLKDAGYSADAINSLIETVVMSNSLLALPEDIQKQFEFSDCLVDIPLTEEILKELNTELIEILNRLTTQIDETKSLLDAGRTMEAESRWWDTDENLKAQEYYFYNLCGFSRALHKPWDEYLKKQDLKNANKDNIFFESDEDNNTKDSTDLSWLNSYM